MTSNIKIISDGTAQGTKVMVGDHFVEGITRIEVKPVKPFGVVEAVITVSMPALELALKNAEIECTDEGMAAAIQGAITNMCKKTV